MKAAAAAAAGDGAAALPEPPDDELAGLARAVRGTLSLAGGGGGGGRPPAADGGGGTDPSSTPPPPPPPPPPPGTAGQVPPGGAVIICDLWYGLPTQRRPRRERVNAVARQLRNFEAWRSGRRRRIRRVGEEEKSWEEEEEESWEGGGGGGGGGSDCGAARGSGARFRAVLVGDGADVGAVGDRLRSLRSDEGLGNRDRDHGHGHDHIIELLPGRTVEGEAGRLLQGAGAGAGAGAVYLSPDAPASLDARRPPPRAVVVGMLIDRRVIPNRSLRQAERLSLPAVRLPMDQLRVEGLRSSEALNVDTVLELMERWWDGVDGLAEGSGDDGDCLRRCFLDAALGAMCSHEDRHPNRPVHGSGSQK